MILQYLAREMGRMRVAILNNVTIPPSVQAVLYSCRLSRGFNGAICRRSTCVIEGFPRSANSFLFNAINHDRSTEPGTIAHHVHHSFQWRLAEKRGIKSIIVVRDPMEAVVSLLVSSGDMTLTKARYLLRWWLSFYCGIESANHILLLDYKDVSEDTASTVIKGRRFLGLDGDDSINYDDSTIATHLVGVAIANRKDRYVAAHGVARNKWSGDYEKAAKILERAPEAMVCAKRYSELTRLICGKCD